MGAKKKRVEYESSNTSTSIELIFPASCPTLVFLPSAILQDVCTTRYLSLLRQSSCPPSAESPVVGQSLLLGSGRTMSRSSLWPVVVVFCVLCVLLVQGSPELDEPLTDAPVREENKSGWEGVGQWFEDSLGWKFTANYDDVMKWQNYVMVGATLTYIVITIVTAFILCCCCVKNF
uniref:Small integral membrane protein 50 n=1 Tax=Steinernema glaseri TaxID=37863 RepID=A0A1I7ZNL9_9BILA